MSKNRPPQPPDRGQSAASRQRQPRRPGQLSLALRLLVSLLVIWHVTAVFMAPFSIPPTSPMVVGIAQDSFMQNYLDLLCINHGYHFFAPDPGPGHLIHYQLQDERGGIIGEGSFPHKEKDWPRLLYHRYFMLAEQCEVPARSEAEDLQWKERFLTAFARQLLRENDSAAAVRVQRILHKLLMLPDALEGKQLDDRDSYEPLPPVVTQRRQNLDLPPPAKPSAYNSGWQSDVAAGWQGAYR